MSDRNPYENDETVDIPDFSSIKSDDDIDPSLFKMDDNDDFDDEDDDEYYDDEPKYRTVRQPVIVVTAILLVVLLTLSIGGLIFGLKKNSAYNSLKQEYDSYVTKADANISSLNAQITDLQTKIAKLEKGAASEGVVNDTYKIGIDGIRVRSGAGLSNATVKYKELSADIQKVCDATEDGTAYMVAGKTIAVSEIKTEETAEHTTTWAKIADNAWICINYDGEVWCTKQ